MDEKLLEQIKDLTGIENVSGLEAFLNSISDHAPVIGKILTSFKIQRLGKRLKTHEKQISEISLKMNQIDDKDFIYLIKNMLFPTVLQELLDEDEDKKIGFFLDGFNQVVDNQINEQSKILIYYDVLRELRFIEMEYLITFSTQYKVFKMNTYYETGNLPESIFDNNNEFNEIRFTVENKLERLGLINTGRLITYKQIMQRMDDNVKMSKRHLAGSNDFEDEVELTHFGYEFLEFFCLLEKYEK